MSNIIELSNNGVSGIQSTIAAFVDVAQMALPYLPDEAATALRSVLAAIPEKSGEYPSDAEASKLLESLILRLQKLNGVR